MEDRMEQLSERSRMQALAPFIGSWRLGATPPGGPPWPGEGRVTFEWLEGASFLIQRWSVEMPEAPDGIALIGSLDDSGRFRQHYFDSRGVHRIYEMSFQEGVWKLWRDGVDFSQRFNGVFSEDGRSISGTWEIAEDGVTWRTDFDETYVRID
jgi:hypothetical protein